jgi:hypothetical protein
MIKRIIGIYFSPVGGTARMTRRLVSEMASVIRECSPEEITTECYDLRDMKDCGFGEETIAVIAMPAYIGKLPLPGIEALRAVNGGRAMTVTAVSYGGRSYGNALFELRDLAEECGFTVIGAGAFAISYMAVRGSARSAAPAMDTVSIMEFGKAAAAKVRRLGGCEIEGLRIKPAPLEVKGRKPVHKISRISPKAAAIAQELLEKLSFGRKNSEWFL